MTIVAVATERVCFSTDLGWLGMLARHAGGRLELAQLVMGHSSERAAERALGDPWREAADAGGGQLDDWADLLGRYAAGEPVDLSMIPVTRDHLTPFARRVAECCSAIPYAQTRSYGELARAAGSPSAARAVGSVMSSNRTPLVVPCHRVLGAGGRLGGFSAPQGVAMKRRLLQLEGSWLW